MLQTIREHTQGWIAGTIVTLLILSFAFWGIHSYFETSAGNLVVAKVNGTEIVKEQLSLAYERLRRQEQSNPNASLGLSEAELKKRALQMLIEIEVLKQASLDQNYLISNRQMDNYLQSMPAFQINGQFSVERFNQILSSTSLSTSEFLDLIKTSLLIDQPKLGIIFTSFALPNETTATMALVNQERDIHYLLIPVTHFLSKTFVIPIEKVQAYYREHQNDFKMPEQVNIEYLDLSLKDLMAGYHPDNAALKQFYDENINAYTKPREWKLTGVDIPKTQSKEKAQEIAQALQQGKDLSKLAPYSIRASEWFTLMRLPEDLQKSVSSLVKPGQVTAPIKTKQGWVVLKVSEIKEPEIQSFETVKEKVNEIYVRRLAEEKYAQLRERLADLTYEHPDSLTSAAKALNLPIKLSGLFSKDKGDKSIADIKKIRDAAFSNDVLTLQNNSDVIQVTSDRAIVLRIKSHHPSYLLPLESVKPQIQAKLKTEQAELQAGKLAEEIKNKLQAGSVPGSIAQSYSLHWIYPGYIGRYATKVDSAILEMAFTLPNPMKTNKVMYGVTRVPNGFAVVGVKSVRDGDTSDKKQYSIFAEQVQNSDGLLEYELYKQSLIEKAKITIENPS